MKSNFLKFLLLISFINYIQNEIITTNITIQDNEFITDLDAVEGDINNKQNNTIDISKKPIININYNIIKSEEIKKDLNVTVYDKNKIIEIITKESFSKNNNSKINENIIENDNITKIDEIENIIIQNTHEDQLAESLFYFLTFVLIIFIILFLYKFYKCYCESTIKDFGEEGTIQNPNNDPELQRISTHDEDNIMEVADNSN